MKNDFDSDKELKDRAYGVVKRLPDLIYQTDMDNIIVLANPAFAEIFGFSSVNEIIGTNIKDLYVYPDGRQEFLDKLRKSGGKLIGEIVFVKKKNEEPFFLSVDSHIICENGSDVGVEGVEGVGRDITKQIPGADRLIELWKREHTLIQRSLVGIYVIQDEAFKFVNEAFVSIFRSSERELIGKRYLELVSPSDRPRVKKEVESKLSGESRLPYTFKGVTKDESNIMVKVDSATITYEGKDALLGTLIDITEETRLREDLEEIVKERTEVLGRFTEDIAHELKSPMNIIFTMVDNYKRGLIKEQDLRLMVEKICKELDRMNLLTDKLWKLILIESGKFELRLESINVYQEIDYCWKILKPRADEIEIKIDIDSEIKQWKSLRTDRDIFRHIVINLLDNAIKYSYPRSYIKIFGKAVIGSVLLSFSSKGKHISEEDLKKIFDKHYRTKDAIDMVPAGSGIGLYIVKKFIELLYGKVEAKSNAVQGATKGESLNIFTITFSK
jgi:two-component system, LuxR family, sensor kinase FixL